MNEDEDETYSFLDANCESPVAGREWFEDYILADQDPRLKIPTSNNTGSSLIDNTEFIVAALKYLGIQNATQTLTIDESMKVEVEEENEELEFDDLGSIIDDSVSDIVDQINIDHGIPSLYVQVSIPSKGNYEGRIYLVEKLPEVTVQNEEQSNEQIVSDQENYV